MIVPHKPCPWCGTVKHLSGNYTEGNYAIGCLECGCVGPFVELTNAMDRPDHEAFAKWDEMRTNEWQDYEVGE